MHPFDEYKLILNCDYLVTHSQFCSGNHVELPSSLKAAVFIFYRPNRAGRSDCFIISFYLLGTDYYKCHSTSIISSGSRYAKSKEICSQRGSGGYYDLLVGGRKKSVNPLS